MRYINTELVVRLCLSLLLLSVPGIATAETIQLVPEGGVFMVPARINDAFTIRFVLDTGASDVSVPEDVFKTLRRTGTVTERDFLSPGTYTNADGLARSKRRFILHEVRVGDRIVKDVVASVASDNAPPPLLGQSFLGKLPGWAIDNTRHALVIDAGGGGERLQMPGAPARTAMGTMQPVLGIVEAKMRGRNALEVIGTDGLPADNHPAYFEAAKWYRIAAEQGDAAAQYQVGYLQGPGMLNGSDQEAEFWSRKAAEQDYCPAILDLMVSLEMRKSSELGSWKIKSNILKCKFEIHTNK